MTKHITLEQLEAIEKDEYEELLSLQRIAFEAYKEGDSEKYQRLTESVKYAMGRWGIIIELIEQIEKIN